MGADTANFYGRNMPRIRIEIVDKAQGDIVEHEFDVAENSTVDVIRKHLKDIYPGEPIFSINNHLLELEDDDVLDEMMDDEDTLTAVKHEPSKEDRWRYYDLENDSESIVVIINKRTKQPMIIPALAVQTLRLSSVAYRRTITVFRKQYEVDTGSEKKVEKKIEGETEFIGWIYKLPEDSDTLKFKITKEGVSKITDEGVYIDIPRTQRELRMLEGDFYKSTKQISFINHGVDIYVVVGRMRQFEAILLKNGQEKVFELKSNSKDEFEFGLGAKTTQTEIEVGRREFQADMFNALQVDKGKKIKIESSENERNATLVTVDGREHSLQKIRNKTFKDEDRITAKNWLGWVSGVAGNIGQGIVGGIM